VIVRTKTVNSTICTTVGTFPVEGGNTPPVITGGRGYAPWARRSSPNVWSVRSLPNQ